MSSDDETDSQTNKRSTRGRGRGRGRPPGRPAKKAKKTKVEKTPKKEIIDSKKVKTEKSYEKSKELDLDLKKDSIDFENMDSELTSHPMTSFVNPMSTPLHQNQPLNWKVRVNLVGEKVVNPRIHCCEKCFLPILVYGRMMQCKHVFCLKCCEQHEGQCPRCGLKVIRVETIALGNIFMCQIESCKRTYLSQRDLQSHIEHRHLKHPISTSALSSSNNTNIISPPTSTPKEPTHSTTVVRPVPFNSSSFQSPIPVVSSRTKLISVPIQEEVNTSMSSMSQTISGQTSMIIPHTVSNYMPPQNSYNPVTAHMNLNPPPPPWTLPQNPYAPTNWSHIGNPYNNPYTRPYYPQ